MKDGCFQFLNLLLPLHAILYLAGDVTETISSRMSGGYVFSARIFKDSFTKAPDESVRISAYTNQSRVSHSVRMRENSAEEYPKQSSLERSF